MPLDNTTPAGGLAQAASGGNNTMAGMFEELLRRQVENKPPSPEERQGALSAYTTALRTPADDREGWQVLMEGINTSRGSSFWEDANNAFRHKALWEQTQRESRKKLNDLAAKTEYEDVMARQKQAMELKPGALRSATGPQGFEFRKNTDGTTTAFSKATGAPVGTYGPQDIGKITALTQTLAKAAFERGDYASLDEALAWAQSAAMAQVAGANEVVGNRNAPLTGNVGGVPAVAPAAEPAVIEDTTATTPGDANFRFDVSKLGPEERALVQRLIARYRANPNPGTQEQTVRAIQALMEDGKLAQVAAEPQKAMVKKDVPKSKMEEGAAEGVGKSLAKEFEGLRDASAASAQLKMQLETLKELYTTPNLPEGALGERIQGIRSGLKSLGIEVGPEVGAGDLISAISGKMALLTRTAEGGNLMPGAMSDFEQKILRGLVPGLNSTAEGRVALIDFLNDMADVRIRMATEANKMAAANRGVPPADWYQRRDRIMKEEQARLAVRSRELAGRFKGTK